MFCIQIHINYNSNQLLFGSHFSDNNKWTFNVNTVYLRIELLLNAWTERRAIGWRFEGRQTQDQCRRLVPTHLMSMYSIISFTIINTICLTFYWFLVLSIDAIDVSGEQHINIEHNIYKRRLNLKGEPIEKPEKETGQASDYH